VQQLLLELMLGDRGGGRTYLYNFLKMTGSVLGPERVCLRKAKRAETTTTTSRDSRKMMKNTRLVSQWSY
jgi:hypothetical protein